MTVLTDKPLVSAVILTFNQEQYIRQTIDCVLSQITRYSFEVVIGEDCSTDNTRSIIHEYIKRYPNKIKIITSDSNVGLLDNYYRMVNAARGKYIVQCAGDDYWHCKNKIEKQITFLENNPEYGMVHSDADILKEDEARIVKNRHKSLLNKYESNNTLDHLVVGDYPVVASSAAYKKYYFDKYFDLQEIQNNGIIMEDMPLWLSIAAHSKIHYINESLITHREMAGTITNPRSFQRKQEIWESCRRCFLFYYDRYKDKLIDKTIDKRLINQHFNSMLQKLAMRANKKHYVREYYKKILHESGSSYLTFKDKVRYYVTFLPLGVSIYNIIGSKIKRY